MVFNGEKALKFCSCDLNSGKNPKKRPVVTKLNCLPYPGGYNSILKITLAVKFEKFDPFKIRGLSTLGVWKNLVFSRNTGLKGFGL